MALVDGLFQPPLGVTVAGVGELPSVYDVSGLAAASMAEAATALAALSSRYGHASPRITVDRQLAGLWFGLSFRPVGWTLPPAWDALAGDYPCAGGWIRLHTNAAHHRAAALQLLGCPEGVGRDDVARHVAGWDGEELEAAVVSAGGAAALMRTAQQWRNHPQGLAVAAEPLTAWGGPRVVNVVERGQGAGVPTGDRPLAGVRVLDLTRVIAGPVATRFLAMYGAEVLRLDPPDWEEPALEPEMTAGKNCARLDFKTPAGLATLRQLLSEADIVIHGYRRDALDKVGLSDDVLAARHPALVNVALNAYGWSGPWSNRRGFDSLVQMSCGIAAAGMARSRSHVPVPLPVQALDHAIGYLCAAAAITAWRERLDGTVRNARLSLARTAALLMESRAPAPDAPPTGTDAPPAGSDAGLWVPEPSRWGPGLRLRPAVDISGVPSGTHVQARGLGWNPPTWPPAPSTWPPSPLQG